MPKGSRHVETGLLLEGQRPTNLILQRDDGGVWQLDASAAVWAFLGKRVRICGLRAGFDLLEVEHVELAP
jgi:hypothetical protein